ncbi:MAG: type II toxin-antitoxin system VapC family toxin [Candidatus Brockarchaeota archaeon]|nr:type II toxin-antitoxin system VapC family toxin [Candidatus Brockarchaeota archaeon]
MPLLENDVIFAYLNEHDPNHEMAERIFGKLRKGEIRVEISSISLVEMELIYRSEKRENRLLKDLAAIAALPNVEYVALTPDTTLASVYLRQTLNLTFFDSHYAATALNLDGKIISFDQAYDKVPGLTRIEPEAL